MAKIPKAVHLIWIHPEKRDASPPVDVMANIQCWTETHREYAIKVWDAAALAHEFPEIWAMTNECRFMAMKSDVLRLALILRFGGYYSDLKNRPRMPFLNEFEDLSEAIILEHSPTVPNYQGRINNCFFAASANHPFFMDCFDRVKMNIINRVGTDVVTATGVGPIMATIKDRLRDGIADYKIIQRLAIWGTGNADPEAKMFRTSATYNGRAMEEHWSIRQQKESIYI